MYLLAATKCLQHVDASSILMSLDGCIEIAAGIEKPLSTLGSDCDIPLFYFLQSTTTNRMILFISFHRYHLSPQLECKVGEGGTIDYFGGFFSF